MMFAAVTAAAPTHAFTATGEYQLASGARVVNTVDGAPQGLTLTWAPCSQAAWDNWDEGLLSDSGDELVFGDANDTADDAAGEAALTPAFSTTCGNVREANGGRDGILLGVHDFGADGDHYTKLSVVAEDENFDSTYITACIWTGRDGDTPTICDGDDISASGCGTLDMQADVKFGGEIDTNVFVSGVVLQADTLEPCFGSSGHVVGVFS